MFPKFRVGPFYIYDTSTTQQCTMILTGVGYQVRLTRVHAGALGFHMWVYFFPGP